MKYWEGHPRYGRIWDSGGYQPFGPLRGEVDAVDGLLMVLSRTAMERVRFDEQVVDGFHGYDADYCLECRRAGLRVVVEPFWLFHESAGNGAAPEFEASQRRFVAKWQAELRGPRLVERSPRLAAMSVRAERLARSFEPGLSEMGRLVRNATSRLGPREDAPEPPEHPLVVDAATPPPSTCAACGSADLRDRRPTLPIVDCRSCGHGRTWPPPSVDISTEDIFVTGYGDSRESLRARWLAEARLRVDWLKIHTPEGLVLEVGAATGEFATVAGEEGYESYGVEPSEWAAASARQHGAEVLTGTLDDWQREFDGFTVDAVAMFHSLEHVDDPVAVLAQCRSVLADDGRLFVEVPNYGCRAAAVGDTEWIGWSFEFHVSHFTATSICRIMAQAGLEAVEVRELSGRPYMKVANWEHQRARDRQLGYATPDDHLLRIVARPTVRVDDSA
jgi:SAM-dependent methyltransferase